MNRDLKILLTEVEDKKKRPHQSVVNMGHWLMGVCRHKSGGNSSLVVAYLENAGWERTAVGQS